MSYFLCLSPSSQNYLLAYYPDFASFPLPLPTPTPTWLPLADFSPLPTQDSLPKDCHDVYEPLSLELREESPQNWGGRAGRSKRRKYRNHEKNVESARKNGELNIINQFFSFYKNRGKSERAVATLLQQCDSPLTPQTFDQVYSVMQLLTSRKGRKYINLNQFLNLFAPDRLREYFPHLEDHLMSHQVFTLPSLCRFLKRSVFYYLQHVCLPAVLTSRRIVGAARKIHL